MAVPPEAVWPFLARFEHWPTWGPSIRAVDVDADEVGVGVTGRVRSTPGPWLTFEITQVSEGRSWAWRVADVPATGHEVTTRGTSGSLVAFDAPWWAAAYLPVLRVGLHRLRSAVERG